MVFLHIIRHVPPVLTIMSEFQPVLRGWSVENDRWAIARCCQGLVFLCSRCIWHWAQQLAHPGQYRLLLKNNNISRAFFLHPEPYLSFFFFTPQDPAGIFELVEVVGNGTYGQVYKVCWRLRHGLSCFYREYSGLSVFSFPTLHQSWVQMKGMVMTCLPDVVISSDCAELAAGRVSLFGLLSFKGVNQARSYVVHHRSYITCLAAKEGEQASARG